MKVTTFSSINSYDGWRSQFRIEVQGPNEKCHNLSFHDGEPEDNTLSRNFNDVYSITNLIELAYQAGVVGEKLEIEHKEEKW